jgi:putative SOS response-associated peptidase YedK
MCGRTALEASLKTIQEYLQIKIDLDFTPSKEIFPTQDVLSIIIDPKDGLKAGSLKWGFWGPRFNKRKNEWGISKSYINSRTEDVLQRKTFVNEFNRGQFTGVIVTSFDEWPDAGPLKGGRYKVKRKDDQPFILAGLWQKYVYEKEIVYNATVHTKEPIGWITKVHDRMPCIISLDDFKELNHKKDGSYEDKIGVLSRFNEKDLDEFEYQQILN